MVKDPAAHHPAFAPYRRWWSGGALPDLAALNAAAQERAIVSTTGAAIRFVAARAHGALAYERAVAERGTVATRAGSPHDVFNALAWLAFPRAKAALNARHVAEGARACANGRSRARDAATLLDESGLVLACADDGLAALLRARAWRPLFVDRRDDVRRAMRPFVVGHGLLEKLLHPYRAATAHALIVRLDPAVAADETAGAAAADAAAALAVGDAAFTPARLAPVPVAAFPGWDSEGLGERLFDDRSVFRE
jgi:hypothetical protein